MLEIELYKNNNLNSAGYGLYYGRVDTKEIMDVDALADHMSHHNTPFSKGTIKGILQDMVDCIREQTLNGKVVKIANLALFKCHIESRGVNKPEKFNLKIYPDKTQHPEDDGCIKSVHLTAQATGDFTKKQLAADCILGYTNEAAKMRIPEEEPEP